MNHGYAGKIKNCSTCSKTEDSGLSKKVLILNCRQFCKLYTNAKEQNYKLLLIKNWIKGSLVIVLTLTEEEKLKLVFYQKRT